MSNIKKLMMSAAGDDAIVPEGVTFDGSYQERLRNVYGSSGKFYITMSFWFYVPDSNEEIYSRVMTNGQDQIRLKQIGDYFYAYFYNSNFGQQSAGTKTFSAAKNTWNHLVFSGSFTSSGNKIQFYLNDVDQGDLTLSNDALAMTEQEYVAQVSNVYGNIGMAHLYIRDAVLDLSVEANRRNFITSDLKPAEGQGSYLNPRVYLPMLDADTAGANEGSNNDFTVNGTLDTATRGPNQNNCVASFFNTSDSIGVYSLTIPNGSYVLTSFTLNTERIDGGGYVLYHGRLQWGIETSYAPGRLYFNVVNTSGDTIFRGEMRNRPLGVQNHYVFAYDASTATYQFYENGVDTTFDSVTTQTTGTIHYTDSTSYTIGDGSDNKSAIGEFYLDNVDIDLSTNNPFWDSDTNKPKPVRQVLDETGSTPYIAMPLNAANPQLNLGTGSQGQASSLPYQGYRGASEYWAKSLNFNNPSFNSGKRLTLNNPDESPIRKTTLALAFKRDNDNALDNVALFNVNSSSANNYQFSLLFDASENLNVYYNGYQVTNLGNITNQNWHIVLLSIDSTTSTAHAYLDGVSKTATITANRAYTQAYTNVGGAFPGFIGFEFDGDIAFVYQSHDYIDLSDEANRNLFVDQFGYPKDLTPAIEAGDIAEPKVYLRFEDTGNFGKNDGSYGDFTDYTDSESGPDFNFPYL